MSDNQGRAKKTEEQREKDRCNRLEENIANRRKMADENAYFAEQERLRCIGSDNPICLDSIKYTKYMAGRDDE